MLSSETKKFGSFVTEMHLNFFMKTMDFRKDKIKISVNYKLVFHDTRNVKHYLKNIRLGYFSQ